MTIKAIVYSAVAALALAAGAVSPASAHGAVRSVTTFYSLVYGPVGGYTIYCDQHFEQWGSVAVYDLEETVYYDECGD